jgi:hypothetical protein
MAPAVRVIMALIMSMVDVAWLPRYPIWAINRLTVATAVIWALTAQGRDVAAV